MRCGPASGPPFRQQLPGGAGKQALRCLAIPLPFFKKCDGSLTVRQIALHLSEYLNIPLTKSLRLTAYAAYIFAQLGLIRSAIYYTDYPIKEKVVKVPPARKREILHYLSIVRITKNNLLSDIKRR